MPKNKTQTTAENAAPATTADIAYAETLISSTRKERGWIANVKIVEALANPSMQSRLHSVARELSGLGIDVTEIVKLANEGGRALGAMIRLDESAGRAHQRVVELNKRLLNAQTALLSVKKTAAPKTAVATALAGLAGLRAKQVTQSKAAKTKGKNAKKSAASTSVTKV